MLLLTPAARLEPAEAEAGPSSESSDRATGVVELDKDSLGAGFREHARAIRSFLLAMGVGPEDAADLTADVFVVALQRRQTFFEGRGLRPWLFGIAVNLARRHRTKQWLRSALTLRFVSAAKESGSDFDPECRAMEAESARLVHSVLETMPYKMRTLLVLRECEEMNTEEIALALQIPRGSVHSGLHHARKEFMRRYRQRLLIEGKR